MISLCTFVKDEENCLEHMINSIHKACGGWLKETVVVDAGSTDETPEIARALGARVYKAGLIDFGSMRTLAAHLARQPWVLMVDADETLEATPEQMVALMKMNKDAFAFPRKRWLDIKATKQTEEEAYPDWQVRFFQNKTDFVWKRELHEYFHGGAVTKVNDGPVIHHFHDVFKNFEKLSTRQALYTKLAKQAGVTIEGGKEI